MAKRMFIAILTWIACFAFAYIQSVEAAGPVFFADFGGGGVPDDGVNDPENVGCCPLEVLKIE
ncbi:hypothetical protein ACFL6S_31555 [Candidatus Poribacteria bacterium]